MGRHGHASSSPLLSRRRRDVQSSPRSPQTRTPRQPNVDQQSSNPRAAEPLGSTLRSSTKKRKGKKSRSKWFHLMLQEAEKSACVYLTDMSRSDLLCKVGVPGQYTTPEDPAPISVEACNKARLLLIGLKNFLFAMKGYGVSMKGEFSLEHLVWIPATKQIKLRKKNEADFVKFTIHHGEADANSIAESIEKMMEHYKIPADLMHWIKLLKTNPYNKRYLVQNHVCLMAPIAKLHHFIFLYGELEKVQQLVNNLVHYVHTLGRNRAARRRERDKVKCDVDRGDTELEDHYQELCAAYEASVIAHDAARADLITYVEMEREIIMAVHSGDTERENNWRSITSKNEFLKTIFDAREEVYLRAKDLIGLLLFVRNSSQHLIKLSLSKVGGVRFGYLEMVKIITYNFPCLFHEFQQAMSDAGVEDPSFQGN